MDGPDLNRLLAEAVAKHGIRLDPHDPAMVVVTLNRLVLEETSKSLVAEIRSASREFLEAAERVQSAAGTAMADEVRRAMAAVRESGGRSSGSGRPGRSWHLAWLAGGCVAGVVLFVAGLIVGRMLR